VHTTLLDLNEDVTEGLALVQREIKSHRSALPRFARDLPPVLADHVELQQIVINLMIYGM
jgi:phosphoglycerate-specific signal transduction histidine kinase